METPAAAANATRRVLLAGFAWSALSWPGRAAGATQKGEIVPWPTVTLLDGRSVDAAQWQNQVGVVVFWSTTCPFCRRHNQHIEKLQRAARGAGLPLRVLGVARDRDANTVRRYAEQQGYSFPITMEVAPLAAVLAPRSLIPQTAVVGRDGRLVQLLPGEMFEEDVMELLDLARPSPKARS